MPLLATIYESELRCDLLHPFLRNLSANPLEALRGLERRKKARNNFNGVSLGEVWLSAEATQTKPPDRKGLRWLQRNYLQR